MRKGGYVLIDSNGPPEAIVIATGSEVGIAAPAVKELQAAGKRVRLVSMPCTEVFDAQDAAYRESVLPASVHAPPRRRSRRHAVVVAVRRQRRAASSASISFGASGKAPGSVPHFGFTSADVKAQLEQLLHS